MHSSPKLMLVDVRSAESRARSGWIAGSVNVRDVSELKIDPDSAIVVYCDCPNDASAAAVERKFKAMGFKYVRPLAGGISAWRSRGYPLEPGAAS
jgi:rhodanese-related sulfurtransferase